MALIAPNLLVLAVLESALIVEMSNLVLSGPEDGYIVVDDCVFWARRRQLQQNPRLFSASKLSLVHIVPAVALVVLEIALLLYIENGTLIKPD